MRPSQNDAALVGPVAPPSLHVMSWNIRRTMPTARQGNPDFWPERRPLVERLLQVEAPALIGVQEAMARQADDLSRMLGPDIHRIGYGRRGDGRGEGCPVFYDTRRLKLLSWRQYALSPNPERPGSRGWGNMVPRIAVAARFRLRDPGDPAGGGGVTFTAVNVHLDHLSRRSRLRSAEMLADLVRPEEPVVIMGDFNDTPGSAPYRAMTRSGFHDTWAMGAERRGPDGGTYSAYRAPTPNGRRIDWMLVRGPIEVEVAAINPGRFEGRAPSDHEPIHGVLRIGRPALP